MPNNKQINTRIQHKHDTESNWIKALNFIPKAGEIIVYDPDDNYDYARIKIGDGLTLINELKFSEIQPDWNVNDENDPAYIRNKPFYEIKGDWVLVSDEFEIPMIKIPIATDVTEGLSKAGMYRFTVNEKDTYIYHKEQDGIIADDILIEATNSNGLPFGIVVFNGSQQNYILRRVAPPPSNVTSFKVEYSAQSIKYLDDLYISSTIARASELVGKKTVNMGTGNFDGEIFNDYENNTAHTKAHAEGGNTHADGSYSHAEGLNTKAYGNTSHAEGSGTGAYGTYSHAEGQNTIASGWAQHAQGKFNIQDSAETYAHIVGNGYYRSGITARSNAHTLDWDGNAWFAGDVYVGSTSGINKDEGSKKLATEEFVSTAISAIPTPDVSGQIATHNTSNSAHSDIRELLSELNVRLNTLADSDDITLDQISEIVNYIKNNKSLIEGVTTNKVNVADIVDNLITNVANKPLSAAQGVALKSLIDTSIEEVRTDIEPYIFNIDYDTLLAFDTSQIVFDNSDTTSILGKAILGKMILV